MYVPGLCERSDITRVGATGIAHLHTARVGLAILRFRQSIGKLPDTLTDLIPAYLDAVPKDPFDGNELRYKKRGDGFVIYSIGEDLSDDGGAEQLLRDRKSKKNVVRIESHTTNRLENYSIRIGGLVLGPARQFVCDSSRAGTLYG